jgi:hypothetical protein
MSKVEFSELIRTPLTYSEILKYSKMTQAEAYALPDRLKVRFFYSLRVKHRLRDEAEEKLMSMLYTDSDVGVITLFGPTGAGKTALAETLGYRLQSISDSEHPFIYVKVPAHGNAKVSWKAFYQSILIAGDEPMIEAKRAWAVKDGYLLGSGRKGELDGYCTAVKNMLKNRNTIMLAIDEILHILRYGDNDTAMDTIKSLSDAVTCKILLLGPYDLFDKVFGYGQLVRRGKPIYLGRYGSEFRTDNVAGRVRSERRGGVDSAMEKKIKEKNLLDIKEYKLIVTKLMARWPLASVPAFDLIVETLLEVTLGLVGLLKDLMTECLVLQLNNKGAWRASFFRQAMKTREAIDKIRLEIEKGEIALKNAHFDECILTEESMDEVERLLEVKSAEH